MAKDVIIALDFAGAEQALAFLDRFDGCSRKPFVQIGMELFYAAGSEMVKEIKRRGHKIFLDLKLHDIPIPSKRQWRCFRDWMSICATCTRAAGR